MTLTAGTRLGPYEVVARMGAGGMGEVYEARDTRLDRRVAIKVSREQFSARFAREARTIAQLNHPRICQLYDVGPDYLVMEYIDGRPLEGGMPLDRALAVALEICDALESAHSKGVVHRDLKPANILMTSSGIKLLDFGLAQVATVAIPVDATCTAGLTSAGAILGTAAYMSPEQAEAKPVDARSDIFSLGVVLYELLSGQRAFRGDSSIAVMAAVLREEPAPVSAPDAVRRVIARCLRKSPDDRFQSVAELRDALRQLNAPAAAAQQRPSIAVLPFANMSSSPDDEYFSDGLAEEIINALVKVPGLKVIARTSAFAFKGQNTDIRRIAEVLGVTTVLEGSVRRAGSRIRVTAQLITAADGSHLWSERYDRQMDDLFAMQDEIATAITSELQVKFAPSAAPRPRRQPNLQAYEAYLRYAQHQWLFTPEAFQRSRECLEQAIALDAEFALPYVGMADHHFASTTFGGAAEHVPRARRMAERALELDPELPEAHAMLGVLASFYQQDWSEAERRFQHAMAREPVPWHVRSWYSNFYLRGLRRHADARREAERALEDNPLSQMLHWCLANVLAAGGHQAEALAAYEKSVALDPQFWVARLSLGLFHAVHGHPEAALASVEAARAISANPYTIGLNAGLLQRAGRTSESDALRQGIQPGSAHEPPAMTYFDFGAGDIEQAATWATRAIDAGFAMLPNMFASPFEAQLSQARSWPELRQRLNLPESAWAEPPAVGLR
jgi:TolB-like protein/Tfp pilus assembly protein PilF/predicted Ser/Thr protein kinase